MNLFALAPYLLVAWLALTVALLAWAVYVNVRIELAQRRRVRRRASERDWRRRTLGPGAS
jgi:HAMP domain-containing protein